MAVKISTLGNLAAWTDNTLVPAVDTSGTYVSVKSPAGNLKTWILGTIVTDIGNLWSNAGTQQSSLNSLTGQIALANIGMKGYVDSNIDAANVGMRGYVDAVGVIFTANALAQQSLIGNIQASAYSNINVAAYLATTTTTLSGLVVTGNIAVGNIDQPGAGHTVIGNITQTGAGANVYFNTTGNIIAAQGHFSGITTNSGNINATNGWVMAGTLNVTGNILGSTATLGTLNTSGNILATRANVRSLSVNGNTYLNNQFGYTIFSSSNLDPTGGPANLALHHSPGRTIMGWNHSAGRGEFDIICDRASGSPGGLRVLDWSTANVRLANVLMDVNFSQGMTVYGNVIPSASNVYTVGNTTNWWSKVFSVAATAQYADLAECYSADAPYEPGTVVEFGGSQELTLASEGTSRVAGVVSTNPAYLMNGLLQGPFVTNLALQGRVKCKVIGPISKGDLLESAGGGFARTAAEPKLGCVIGKAIENFNAGEGVIEVVVGRL